MDKLIEDYQLMCKHIVSVLDAYREMVAQEQGKKNAKNYRERFYQLVNHKNEVL